MSVDNMNEHAQQITQKKRGRKPKYSNDEERREAINLKKREWCHRNAGYHNKYYRQNAEIIIKKQMEKVKKLKEFYNTYHGIVQHIQTIKA